MELIIIQKKFENLRYQLGTSSWGGSRYLPYSFTEHGITMLSSILKSDTAINVNIAYNKSFYTYEAIQQQL